MKLGPIDKVYDINTAQLREPGSCNCDCKYCDPWMMTADSFSAQNQIREFNPDSITHSPGEPVIECDPSLFDTTTMEEEVQDSFVSSATEDIYIPILDGEEEKNLPDPRLELIDRQFNLKMKELFGQANVEAILHYTATDMLKYLAKSHPLTWATKVKISSEEDELSIWMSTMKDNIDVLVAQFQQQMYTGFSKMLVEMGKLYHK